MPSGFLDHVRELAMLRLTTEELRTLIGDLEAKLEGTYQAPVKKPFRSVRGALADLGPAPSAEDIDEARREAWDNFPRDDF